MKLTLSLASAVVVLFLLSLLIGPASIGVVDGLSALIAAGDEAAVLIMREVRLPRALLAALVGDRPGADAG